MTDETLAAVKIMGDLYKSMPIGPQRPEHAEFPARCFLRTARGNPLATTYGNWECTIGPGDPEFQWIYARRLLAHAIQYLANPDRFKRPKRGSSAVKTGRKRK